MSYSWDSPIRHIIYDATYNLIVEGFPCFTVGNSDRNKKFPGFGLGITSHETKEDFVFVFNAVQVIVNKICAINYNPSILIADNAPQIILGFVKVFYKWSMERAPQHTIISPDTQEQRILNNYSQKKFSFKSDLTTNTMIDAYKYLPDSLVSFMLIDEGTTKTYYLVSKKSDFDNQDFSQYIRSLKERKWMKFDDMIKEVNSVKVIYFDKETWENSLCSRSFGQKHYLCIHIILLANKKGSY